MGCNPWSLKIAEPANVNDTANAGIVSVPNKGGRFQVPTVFYCLFL